MPGTIGPGTEDRSGLCDDCYRARVRGTRAHLSLGHPRRAFCIAERCIMKHADALVALAAASVLGVAACGGGGAAPTTPTASHTTSTSPVPLPTPRPGTHTARPGEPALIAVPGYDYADVPDAAPSEKAIINSAPQVYRSASVHIVLHGGKKIAVILLIQVKPTYANLPEVMSELVKEIAGSGEK